MCTTCHVSFYHSFCSQEVGAVKDPRDFPPNGSKGAQSVALCGLHHNNNLTRRECPVHNVPHGHLATVYLGLAHSHTFHNSILISQAQVRDSN